MAKRARWMRNGAQTVHEEIAKFVMDGVCTEEFLTLKNQKIFHDEGNKKWYITDFFIPELKLIIEIDGMNHQEVSQKEYDKKRTSFLESIGNRVIRFDNAELESLDFRGKFESMLQEQTAYIHVPQKAEPDLTYNSLTSKELEAMADRFLKNAN